MNISIVNGWYLQISIDENIVYNQINEEDGLIKILNSFLPSINWIKNIYLYSGPGSITGCRMVIAYILGLTMNHTVNIYYIDMIKDWYLYHWPNKKIIFPFTNKKFLIGYELDGQYKYYFIDNLKEINWDNHEYLLDYSIKKYNDIIIKNELIIKYWNSNDLFQSKIYNNGMNNIIEYKKW